MDDEGTVTLASERSDRRSSSLLDSVEDFLYALGRIIRRIRRT